jgi:hypothetical protein
MALAALGWAGILLFVATGAYVVCHLLVEPLDLPPLLAGMAGFAGVLHSGVGLVFEGHVAGFGRENDGFLLFSEGNACANEGKCRHNYECFHGDVPFGGLLSAMGSSKYRGFLLQRKSCGNTDISQSIFAGSIPPLQTIAVFYGTSVYCARHCPTNRQINHAGICHAKYVM